MMRSRWSQSGSSAGRSAPAPAWPGCCRGWSARPARLPLTAAGMRAAAVPGPRDHLHFGGLVPTKIVSIMEVSYWIVSEAVVAGFVGRRRELAALGQILSEVQEQVGAAQPGKCLIIRGRRRIGKAAPVEEFTAGPRVPGFFSPAEIGCGGEPLREFSETVRTSALPEG